MIKVMQVKELKKEKLLVEYEVTVLAKDIDKDIDQHLLKVGKTVRMAGFRPGKIPMNILKQRYGRAVLGEVLEKVVGNVTNKVIQEKNLKPALQPKIEVKEFDEGKDLVYTMAVEVVPEFKVVDLKSIKLEKPVVKVGKKEVDEALERIAKANRATKKIEGNCAAKKGDVVVIDFHGRTAKDNKPHPGMHAHGTKLELGSGQFIPGFEDQLTGKKAGDKVEVKVTFPEAYHAAELAGQDAIFDVEIQEIHEPAEQAINDEFAKSLGLDSEAALREAVQKQIENDYSQMSRMKLKRRLLDALDEGHSFEIPQGMKDLEYQNIMQQIKMERAAEAKGGEAELSKDEQEELGAIADRRVRLGLVLSEIGRANNVKITDQELQRAVIAEAQRYPGQEAQVFEYFRKNRQAFESLRAPVFEDKVVDFVLELASVTEQEVSAEELAQDDDESYLDKKKSGGGKKAKAESDDDKPKAKAKAKK